MEKKSERIEKENLRRFLDRLAEASKGAKGEGLGGEIRRLASRSKRQRVAVNVGKIARCAKADDRVIVPGKVLGSGEIDKRISLCAVEYSAQALQKLKKAGCSTVGIEEILKGGKARLII
jgi:large subunit ribosomal protein L18e